MRTNVSELPHWRMLRLEDDPKLRVLGVVALVVGFLPSTHGANAILWPWDILSANPSVDEALSVLSPTIAGLLLFVLATSSRLTRLGLGMVTLVITLLVMSYTATSRASAAALFGEGVLSFVARNPLILLPGLALVAAGADLWTRYGPRRETRGLLLSGSLLVGAFYLIPVEGQSYLVELAGRLELLDSAGVSPLPIVLTALFALVPLGLLAWALAIAYGSASPGLLGGAARYALPVLSMVLAYRMVIGGVGGGGVLVFVRGALLLAIVVGGLSRALEMVVAHLLFDPLPPGTERSELARDVVLRAALTEAVENDQDAETLMLASTKTGQRLSGPMRWLVSRRAAELNEGAARPCEQMLALLRGSSDAPEPSGWSHRLARDKAAYWVCVIGVVGAVGLLASMRHWPVEPDLRWELRSPSTSEVALFTEGIPEFMLLATQRDRVRMSGGNAAELSTRLRERRRELVAEARDISSDVADRLRELFDSAKARDKEGRRFHRRVVAVNRAVRRVGLPFWLDSFVLHRGDDQILLVGSHEVKQIRRFQHDGNPYAALHVRRMDRLSIGSTYLGFVMPSEPFALILVDQIKRQAEERALGLAKEGTCNLFAGRPMPTPAMRYINMACGRLVTRILERDGVGVAIDPDAFKKRIQKTMTRQTEIHELQHQVDGEGLRVPIELKRILPGFGYRVLHRAAKELSAELTELTNDDPLGVVLAFGSQSARLVGGDRGKYAYAAGVIVNALTNDDETVTAGLDVDERKLVAFWKELEQNANDVVGFIRPKATAAREAFFGDLPARLAQ